MAFNHKIIFKNTLILYIRLFVTIVITFYISRVLFQTLGVEDFGIYNVVGGVAVMFASLKGSFSGSTQRFYNYEIGKSNDKEKVNRIFNQSLLIHIVIALILFLILELVGIYMVNNTLSIPDNRLNTANVIFQFTVLSTILSTLVIPFDAMIIAREKLDFYAVMSIVDVVLKLILVCALLLLEGDKLLYYGLIILFVSFVSFFLSVSYCHKNFEECKIRFYFDKQSFKEMAKFSGWNFLGNMSFSLSNEVSNFFLNIYGGVIANAARGISYQIKTSVTTFLSNALVALRPQATQEYAKGNLEGFFKTIYFSSKMMYFVSFIMALPLFIYVEKILLLWLGSVPEYTVLFLRIILIQILIRSFHEPIDLIFKSCGDLKIYQLISLWTTVIMLLVTYFLLTNHYPIYYIFINMVIAEFLEYIQIVVYARTKGLKLKLYFEKVSIPVVLTTLLSVVIIYLIHNFISKYFILGIITTVIVVLCVIMCIGITKSERTILMAKILKK